MMDAAVVPMVPVLAQDLQEFGLVLVRAMLGMSLAFFFLGLVMAGVFRPITRAIWRLARRRASRQRRQGYITLFGRRYIKAENGRFVRDYSN